MHLLATALENSTMQAVYSAEVQSTLDSALHQSEARFEERFYIDGVFDCSHLGHFNAIRQAKEISRNLTVGINSDAETTQLKATPVLDNEERVRLFRNIKWVDNVAPDTPQTTSIEFLDSRNIRNIVHGDDECRDANGNLVQQEHMDRGRYFEVRRTRGVSTTDFIAKLLDVQKHRKQLEDPSCPQSERVRQLELLKAKINDQHHPINARMFQDFIKGGVQKTFEGTVQIQSSFDFVRFDHGELISKLHKLYPRHKILVGVYSDNTILDTSANIPISTFQERILSMYALRHVDDVVYDVELEIKDTFLRSMDIDIVIRCESLDKECQAHGTEADIENLLCAKQKHVADKVVQLNYDFQLHLIEIIRRVEQRQEEYIRRNKKKETVTYTNGFKEKQNVESLISQ